MTVQYQTSPKLTAAEVIEKIKEVSPHTVKVSQFKRLAAIVLVCIKGNDLKEVHALKLFLLKAEKVTSTDKKFKECLTKIRRRKNEAFTRLRIEQKQSGSTNLLTELERLLESQKTEVARIPFSWFTVSVTVGGVVMFATDLDWMGITIGGVPSLAFLAERSEIFLRNKAMTD
jgi:hypothetical protein